MLHLCRQYYLYSIAAYNNYESGLINDACIFHRYSIVLSVTSLYINFPVYTQIEDFEKCTAINTYI